MKKLCSVLLALALVCCLLPLPARAASNVWDGSVDISWYDPAKTEYYLSTPAQLAGLAALVNGMADPAAKSVTGDRSYLKSLRYDNVLLVGAGGGNVADTVYASGIDFAYKTVYLTADLDMGGVYANGAWSGPNWTPIGGKFPMKPAEAAGDCLTLDTRFNGVLDGQGHTISNLFCDRYAAKGFPYSMAIGLVGYLGGASDENPDITGTFSGGWQPAVRNLAVASGSIYGRRMVGGVVGRVGKTSNGVVIENCANKAAVRSSDSKGVGGICGSAWGSGVIRNCYNTGSVSTTYVCPAGGILGTNEGMDVYNCYSVGKIDTGAAQYGRGIGSHDSGVYTVANCYYLAGSDDDPSAGGYYKGTSNKISVSVSALSSDEMKASSFADRLNANGSVFAAVPGGYPVLWFERSRPAGSFTVTLQQPENGTVALSASGEVSLGRTVSFTSEPAAGYILSYYTVNGSPVSGSFWAVTADCTVSAVFKKLGSAVISIPEYDDFYLSVTRTGWKPDADGGMVWAEGETLHSGDAVLEGNVLSARAYCYPDRAPDELGLEYLDACAFSADGADANADGTFTVTGRSPVAFTARRLTQRKTWLTLADTSWYTGKSASYTLQTAAQLAGLASLVNSKGVAFSGVTIRLGADISLLNADGAGGERTWTVIGTSLQRSFQGTFDGQNHTISGLRAWRAGSYAALFGCCKNAVIENLTVSGSAEGEAHAAYAAGILAWGSGCTLKNCVSWVAVTASGTHAGGIAAYLADGSTVEGCFNCGSVTGASGIGGLVGVDYSYTDRIVNSANFGAVTATGSGTYGTGGLCGRLAGTLTGCVNTGAVSGTDRYVGGLAGYTTARARTTVQLCRSGAAVSSSAAGALVGGLVGYAQNLIWGGCEAADGAALFGKSGSVTQKTAAGAIPVYPEPSAPAEAALPDAFTVTFLADGAVVQTLTCPAGTASVQAPAIPQKDGYTASWAPYEITGRDLTVSAVYRQNLVRSGEITTSGTYFIPWFTNGTLAIAGGLDVTLSGIDGGTDGFENLSVTVGTGTKLTLRDAVLTGETTLLTLADGCTLALAGESRLQGRADAPENACPTVRADGDLTITGSGSLRVEAGVNNAAVYVAPGSAVVQQSGTLSVYKTDKLGFAGGAFWAGGSSFTLAGGTFCGRTDSDNVSVLSADAVTVTGGTLRAAAEKSPAAVEGAVTLSDCAVYASGHSGNSAKTQKAYSGAAAIAAVKSQSGVRYLSAPAWTDVTADSLYESEISYAAAKGWMKGVSKTSFAPGASMTRAMFVTALWRMAGSPAASGQNPFADAKAAWYQTAVLWAAQNKLVTGTAPGAFSPDAPVTVQQAAVFLRRFAGYLGLGLTASRVPDSAGTLAAWGRSAVYWCLGAGVFSSCEAALSEPQAAASRALLARLLRNFDSLRS